jgi:hypothetical protein
MTMTIGMVMESMKEVQAGVQSLLHVLRGVEMFKKYNANVVDVSTKPVVVKPLTLKELRAMAKEIGIKGYSKMKREDLEKRLEMPSVYCDTCGEYNDFFNDKMLIDGECQSCIKAYNKALKESASEPQASEQDHPPFACDCCNAMPADVIADEPVDVSDDEAGFFEDDAPQATSDDNHVPADDDRFLGDIDLDNPEEETVVDEQQEVQQPQPKQQQSKKEDNKMQQQRQPKQKKEKLITYIGETTTYVQYKCKGLMVYVGWNADDYKFYCMTQGKEKKQTTYAEMIRKFSLLKNNEHGDIAQVVAALRKLKDLPAVLVEKRKREYMARYNNNEQQVQQPRADKAEPAARKENAHNNKQRQNAVDVQHLKALGAEFFEMFGRRPNATENRIIIDVVRKGGDIDALLDALAE